MLGLLRRRPSSLQLEADRLARGLLVERHLHPKRVIPTWGERWEQIMERLGALARMDGGFYLDTRSPFTAADIGLVTLSTTDLALYPVANFPVLGSNYFGFLGKQIRIRLFGRITTALTPGNGTFDVYWGTGANANGTILQSSAAFALSASQTNLSWMAEFDVVCRAFGSAGALLCTGWALFNNAVVASTLQPILIPASAPAQVTVDLTAANIVSVQFKRSGSTAETMQVHGLQVIALN